MLARGSHAVVRGRIRSVSHNPRNGLPTVEAELWDGSGTVELVWLGRRRIVGIEPGRSIVVRGRVSEREGHRAIYNPRYELLQSA
jgi:RecG-like helicase